MFKSQVFLRILRGFLRELRASLRAFVAIFWLGTCTHGVRLTRYAPFVRLNQVK
jgi:hypothetical protein